MRNKILKYAMVSITIASLTSCIDDDAPVIINEEELITTVEYTLTNSADASNIVVLKSVDSDGDGPDAPVITTAGTLRANSSYSGAVRFLNENESPAEDITEEVMEESLEHEVFYVTSTTGVQITKLDNDTGGNPLGVRTTFQTGAATTGNLTIVLRHEPIKPNDGSLSGAAGETDAQVSLPLSIQ